MTSGIEPRGKNLAPLLLGGSLVIVGLIFLVVQFFRLDFSIISVLWPFFVVVPGVLIFALALARGSNGEPLASVGSVVLVLGALLLYQNSTGHWENWAYAWALLIPTAVGVGKLLFGSLTQQPAVAREGLRLTVIGSVIFFVGFFFFEMVLGIGGLGIHRLGFTRYAWPIMMIGVGVLVIIYGVLATRTAPSGTEDSK